MPGVRVLVTTFAPTTLPYLEKTCLRSVARVCCDKPETHKLRPCDEDLDEADDDDDFVADVEDVFDASIISA